MGKNPNTFQKRQREMDKKLKAEEKRKRKQLAKTAPAEPARTTSTDAATLDLSRPADSRD